MIVSVELMPLPPREGDLDVGMERRDNADLVYVLGLIFRPLSPFSSSNVVPSWAFPLGEGQLVFMSPFRDFLLIMDLVQMEGNMLKHFIIYSG
jgi:hypothetical protein